MEKETIDRLTVVGLVIFVLLGVVYLFRDPLSQVRLNVSLDPPSAGFALPAFSLPDISLDWFYNMDPPSKIIFVFIMMVLVGTIVGSGFLYMRHRRQNAGR